MSVNLVFEVVLNVPRHYDEGLTHQKQKDALEQSHDQNQNPEQQNTKRKNIVQLRLHRRPRKQKIHIKGIFDQIEGVAHQLCGDNAKKVGNNGENCTQNQVPLVFD